VLTVQAPFAEVFAVVAEDSIAVFAEAGARPVRHLDAVEARLTMAAYPDRTSVREARQGNFFHRESAQLAHNGFVVNDVSVTHVDPMMREAPSRRNEM